MKKFGIVLALAMFITLPFTTKADVLIYGGLEAVEFFPGTHRVKVYCS